MDEDEIAGQLLESARRGVREDDEREVPARPCARHPDVAASRLSSDGTPLCATCGLETAEQRRALERSVPEARRDRVTELRAAIEAAWMDGFECADGAEASEHTLTMSPDAYAAEYAARALTEPSLIPPVVDEHDAADVEALRERVLSIEAPRMVGVDRGALERSQGEVPAESPTLVALDRLGASIDAHLARAARIERAARRVVHAASLRTDDPFATEHGELEHALEED